MVKDLESKLNCVIQNKDYYEQVLSKNQSSSDDNELMKMKYELDKKEKQLKDTRDKAEY